MKTFTTTPHLVNQAILKQRMTIIKNVCNTYYKLCLNVYTCAHTHTHSSLCVFNNCLILYKLSEKEELLMGR